MLIEMGKKYFKGFGEKQINGIMQQFISLLYAKEYFKTLGR